jgi:heme exporter protein D
VSRAVAAATALALAGMYATVGASLIWGLGGGVRVSHYPRAWYAADRLMGPGDESVLFLPWHQYQPFSFTAARSVATPAGAFFRRPVLSSDAPELGEVRTNSASARMAYLDRLVAAGGGGRFGHLIAPLGIRYVALAKDRESESYAWLGRQPDLRPVLRTAELDLYGVTVTGTGRVVSARDGDVAAALGWAAQGRLGTEAVLSGAGGGTVPSAASGGLRRLGSTRWRVAAGEAGWVVLPEEWSASWTAGDQVTRPTVAGTVAVRAGSEAFTVRYAPWKWLRLGLAASLLSLVVLLVAGLVEHRRELYSGFRRRLRGSGRRGGGGGS